MQIKQTEYPFNMITKPIGPLCNLHCAYCFYLTKEQLFPHENKKEFIMSSEIREEYIKQYILTQPEGTPEVVFGWQGGEPTLLGIDFFKDVLRLQKKHNPRGMTIRNSIQSNGTLITDEMANFFKENNFLVGISVDGPEELHNKYRLDRSGKGSFSRVMTGMENLKKHNVDFNTLTVVQDDNSLYPLEVYEFLKQSGSGYIQFIPIVEPDYSGGKRTTGGRTVPSLQWGKFLTSVFQQWLKEDIGKVFVQHFDLTLGQYMGQPSSICVHGKYCGKALAIEHDGSIYSCDHFVNPENYLGHISESLAETAGSEKQIRFGMDKFDALPEECLNCLYLPLCSGGCPKNRLIEKPTGKLNWLCEGYRYYYEKTSPVYAAMARALGRREHAANYRKYLSFPPEFTRNLNRNDLCPCLSGKKFKNCHGR